MKKVYSHQDALCLQNQGDITLHEGCHGAENTMSTYQRKGISTPALAVSAVISGMLYSSRAVAVIQQLPDPVSETIAGENYVSMGG